MPTVKLALATVLLCGACATAGAQEHYVYVDHSSPALIDNATAVGVWRAQVDDSMRRRIQTLYPVSKWGFISQVQGGFNADRNCVVTARALMVPRGLGERLIFEPFKSATAFDTKAGATEQQCRELAASLLKEAVLGVRSSLINP